MKKSDGVMCTSMISTGLFLVSACSVLREFEGVSGRLHDWPVLHAWVMSKPEHAPEHNVFVFHIVLARGRVAYTANLVAALQRVAAAGVQLVVHVLGDPEVVSGKVRAVGLDGAGRGEKQLRRGRRDLVSNGLAADGVLLVPVLDLEDAVRKGCEVQAGRLLDDGRLHLIVVAVGVRLGVDDGR